MPKQKYWLVDPSGVYAQVEGADERDSWVRIQGWAETGEPSRTDQVHVVHEQAGRAQLPYGGLVDGWSALGWSVATPPAPVDTTKDPQLVDQPAEAAAEPEKPATAPASGTATKEK